MPDPGASVYPLGVRRWVIPVLAAALWTGLPRAQAARPLPDAATFLREARAHLQIDDLRQTGYLYTATERQFGPDGRGGSREEKSKVYESYPGLPGERRWERVLAENGTPVPEAELARRDRERQKAVEAWQRKRARMSPADLEAERRDREKVRQDEADALDDAFRVFTFTLLGREQISGQDVITVGIEPKRDVKTKTRPGSWARHVRGKAWVSEADFELARVEFQAIDTLSLGFGVFARLHEGSHLSFERRRMADGVWLPSRAAIDASARVLLLRRYRMNAVTEYSNYRRFGVETSTSYGLPDAR